MACDSGGSDNVKQTVYNALVDSSALTDIVGSDIYYNMLPDRFNVQNPAVSFAVRTQETVRDLEGGILYKTKTVNIRCHSQNQEQCYDMLDAVENAADQLKYENREVDEEPFWDEVLQWYILDMNFEMNEF